MQIEGVTPELIELLKKNEPSNCKVCGAGGFTAKQLREHTRVQHPSQYALRQTARKRALELMIQKLVEIEVKKYCSTIVCEVKS